MEVQFTTLLVEIRDGQSRLEQNQRSIMTRQETIEAEQKRIRAGFPADDVDGHRRYHQAVIEWRELRNNMVRQMLEKMIGAGILGACGWLLLAIWQSFKITVTK